MSKPISIEDDLPTIDDTMIDVERVDFERKMSGFPLLSISLMVLCIVAFAIQAARGGLEDIERLVGMGALDRPSVVEHGEVWRLVSATFMHGGFDHLISNLLMLFVLGMACEHGFGRPQFLFLYVTAGVVGSLTSLLGGRPSVGASGAIFGLAGALMVLFWKYQNRLHLRDHRIAWVLAFWAIYTIGLGFFNPFVDNLAHIGGLLGGALVALLLRPAVLDGRAEVAARPMTWLGLALAIAALATTAVFFVPKLFA
jgi:membrane associated rhomboid family serine protease